MELQAVLVLCGLGVAGVAVLLLMGLFSSSGTSYEEAMAQQRKATSELLALAEGNSKPKKSSKKANKKLAKKEKHNDLVYFTAGSDPESEAPEDEHIPQKPHIESSPPVVVDIALDTPLNIKAVERKEEVVEKKEQQAGKSNKQAKVKQGKAAAAPAAAPEPPKEEPAPRERYNTTDQRKAKKEKKPQAEEPEVGEEVVPPLNVPQPSELTTEKLLKQPVHTPSPKNKKKNKEPNMLALFAAAEGGVHELQLARLVREATLSRSELCVLTNELLNRQLDPLPQHSQWEGPTDPLQRLKRQVAEKSKALADELEASQALHAKLRELRTSLNAERSRASVATRAADEAAAEVRALAARLQRSADDNHALAQEKLMLQSKLAAEGEAQSQRVPMEVHIQRLSESEAVLVAQLQALQAEAAARAHEAAQARCEAAAARDAALLAQQHSQELAQQLQEANRVCSELDSARQGAQQEARGAQERLAALSELPGEVQRLRSRAQAAEAAAEKLKEEADKQKQQLSSDLAALHEQLAAREAELAELKALSAAAPAQNGLPPPQADLKGAALSEAAGAVAALRAELAAAQSDARSQREQAARLHDQLRGYQEKNNEALYIEVARILGAACPAAAPGGAPGRAWLEAFAGSLGAQLAAPGPTPAPAPAPAPALGDLTAKNEHLHELVDKYKKIIDDTEGVLSRLQQDVSTEERRWAEQLSDKQRELDEMRLRTVTQMQSKIDALEAELRRAQLNLKHNFTEEERQTEDRLLADLSKNQLGSLNGPLKVGVEEK